MGQQSFRMAVCVSATAVKPVANDSTNTLTRRLAAPVNQWSPPAPKGADVTIEGDEVYTRVGENLPPQ
jgi:hypothetical protein